MAYAYVTILRTQQNKIVKKCLVNLNIIEAICECEEITEIVFDDGSFYVKESIQEILDGAFELEVE